MKAKKKSYFERFMEMSDAERDAEVAPFDREFVPTKPLTKRDKSTHRRARKVGRPKVGRGAKRFTITMERGLADQAEAFARKRNLSRSEVIAKGVQKLLKAG